MRKLFIFMLFSFLHFNSFSQKESKNSFVFSIPLIFNKTQVVYYQLGTMKISQGDGLGFGINMIYNRILYKNIYGSFGLGYFNQRFLISRPFKFNDPTKLLFFTENYSYDNISICAGIGYRFQLKKGLNSKFEIFYNQLYSYRQEYIPETLSMYSFQQSQINNKQMIIGNFFDLRIGIEKLLNKNFAIGIAGTTPLHTTWEDDQVFINFENSKNEQKIAFNKFTIGTIISVKHFF